MNTPSPFFIGCPSRDGQGLVQSVLALGHLEAWLQRPIAFIMGIGSNIPRARNGVMDQIRRDFGLQTHWVLWWDSDILVTPDQIPAVAAMIRFGQEHQMAVTANYRINTGEHVLMQTIDGTIHRFTDQGLAALPEWAPIESTGLGFCYCPVEAEYIFHADRMGEDVHFWHDHPDLELRVTKAVQLRHAKTVWL